jgi:hypothetical protein
MIYFSYFGGDDRIINDPIFMGAAGEIGLSGVSYVTTCLEWRGTVTEILLNHSLIFCTPNEILDVCHHASS